MQHVLIKETRGIILRYVINHGGKPVHRWFLAVFIQFVRCGFVMGEFEPLLLVVQVACNLVVVNAVACRWRPIYSLSLESLIFLKVLLYLLVFAPADPPDFKLELSDNLLQPPLLPLLLSQLLV